jgi:hypothetical protein
MRLIAREVYRGTGDEGRRWWRFDAVRGWTGGEQS